MAATLADRTRLGELVSFQQRVLGALLSVANTVGAETAASPSDKADRRLGLVRDVLARPEFLCQQFARAAAGWNPGSPATDMADTFADAAGATDDIKQAAISDATILAYSTGAFDILAGVRPWERN
jgi:hypothetical protein